jgi:hypothetical protein
VDDHGEIWARVGGGLELVPGGRRHGPADLQHPPPGGPWEELVQNGRLVGWARPGAPKAAARRAQEIAEKLIAERRSYLLGRLGHKMRSAVLALQEAARQAAFGRSELLEQLYEQAQEVGRRAAALEVTALDPKDVARSVVIGAVLNLSAPAANRELPADAVVRAPETVLVEALERAYEWMGGPGSGIRGTAENGWWRLELTPAPVRRGLAVPEMGEPLVRFLVDTHLDGWLDSSDPNRPVIYLPAA